MATYCGVYELTQRVLAGDRAGLKASLWEATDGGLFLFARTWPRKGALRDLTGFWNLETRTLLRLSGYPRSDDYFVQLKDLGKSDDRYYVILDAGERRPISVLMGDTHRAASIRSLRTPIHRRALWRGARTIATGLGILHAEGTLHRALNLDSIFADDRAQGDFRLSGFEWSLRISGSADGGIARASSTRLRAPELDKAEGSYSFATDWFDFGVFLAELLGFNVAKRGKRALERLRLQIETASQLVSREKHLVLQLLDANPETRLSETSAVLQALAETATAVRGRGGMAEKPLVIGFLLGTTSPISRMVAEITQGRENIRPDDSAAQLDFLNRDLASATHVLVRSSGGLRYVVNGTRAQYRVEQWSRRETTWDVGYCARTEPAVSESSDQLVPLDGRKIEAQAAPQLAQNLTRVRQRCAPWDVALPPETKIELLNQDQRRTLSFFTLTNQLDALLTAAKIWPVRVIEARDLGSRREIIVTPEPEDVRDALAVNLKLAETATQMRDALFGNALANRTIEEADFEISDEGVLVGSQGRSRGRWRFESAFDHPKGVRYVFHSEELIANAPASGEKLYIMPRGLSGTVAQLKRRQRAIENLRQHAGLLTAIANPDIARRDVADEPGESDLLRNLDESKRAALEAMWGTQPFFTLQGPPGTGKTRLLETCVLLLLERDPTQQVLITAHSHEAINNVRRKLSERIDEIDGANSPLVIRLDDAGDDCHVSFVAENLRQKLAKSKLMEGLSENVKKRIIQEAEMDVTSPALKSFEILVRDAANVVLATSNSGELSRMLEDQRRFDWSIIEEAGKAHGFDLALALQSSPRVLMIGDQDQLPPFNFDTLQDLFREPARILEAVKLGARFAPSLVDRSFGTLSAGEAEQFKEDVTAWLQMVLFFSDLYARCWDSERNGVRLAQRLTEQHRMHPVIAEMVSECFYGRDLVTHKDAATRFNIEAPPIRRRTNGWMPDSPIVFIDMPWVQETVGAEGEVGGSGGAPRYTNPLEVEATLAALGELRPIPGQACEVQLLSPYRAQVKLLRERVAEAVAAGELPALRHLYPPLIDKAAGATVDEFQGSEADVVLVSLVRNNDERAGRGLGFLADRRRLNVLLSRARHRLILVGSWRFLESRIDPEIPHTEDEELSHIAHFINWLKKNEASGRVARIPYAEIQKVGA